MNEFFLRNEVEGIVFYSCSAFDAVPRLRHAFTTRVGGEQPFNLTVRPGCSSETVQRNRLHLLSALGFSDARLTTLSQIHSDIVHTVDLGADDRSITREGDALITRQSGIAIAVQVADCFPILLYDRDSGAVAAVHSGWRGTAARVLSKTAARMEQAFSARRDSMMVAIGPGIRSCCMQVGTEVAERFGQEYPGHCLACAQTGREGKYFLDMPAALTLQCAEAGIPSDQIFDIGLCTRCRTAEFFSYRAEGAAAGRMVGLIGLSAP